MPLLKVFTPSEIKQMNEELKTAMQDPLTEILISVFGHESVLIHYSDKIYKIHGGN